MTGYPRRSYAWYVVAILIMVNMISFLDRQILTLLVGPVRHDLGISDTQIGLLQGVAFSLLYGLVAFPMGHLADRHSRRNIIALGLVIWSVMTILCGFATNFWQLFAARIGVGVGEACLGPAAISLLSDYFAPEKRGSALSLYQMGMYFGIGGSMVAGGVVVGLLRDATVVSLPVLGAMSSWKIVFMIAGSAGVVVSPLLVTVKEPIRHERLPAPGQGPASALTFVGFFREHWSTLGLLYAITSFVSIFGNGLGAWLPSLFVRNFGMKISVVGMTLGLVIGAFAVLGCILNGALSDRSTRKRARGEKLRAAVPGWCMAAVAVVIISMARAEGPALCGVALAMLANGLLVSNGPAMLNDALPNQIKGKGMAVYYLLVGIVGAGLAPVAPALVNDLVFHGRDLAHAVLLVALPAILIGLAVTWSSLAPYQKLRNVITALG